MNCLLKRNRSIWEPPNSTWTSSCCLVKATAIRACSRHSRPKADKFKLTKKSANWKIFKFLRVWLQAWTIWKTAFVQPNLRKTAYKKCHLQMTIQTQSLIIWLCRVLKSSISRLNRVFWTCCLLQDLKISWRSRHHCQRTDRTKAYLPYLNNEITTLYKITLHVYIVPVKIRN